MGPDEGVTALSTNVGASRAAASLGRMSALGQELEADERKARWCFARAEALGSDWRPMAAAMGLVVGEWK